jgi:hypothetical protein
MSSAIAKIISAHKHPKEIASFNSGFGVAKQLRRLQRREHRKFCKRLRAGLKQS